MLTGRAEVLRRCLVRLVGLLAVVALLPLASCSEDKRPPAPPVGKYDDVQRLVQRTLNQRATAIKRRDLTAFGHGLNRRDASLVRSEQTYYDNLAQLPIGGLRMQVLADTITPDDTVPDGETMPTDYWAEVLISLRLDGYDAKPVRTRDRFRFTPSRDGQRYVIASTTDANWETGHPGNQQPWDLGPIRVQQSTGILGIFDDATWGTARAVVDAAATGRYEVRAVVPASDDPVASGIVLYAVSNGRFLRGLAGQTVGDPDRADGLTIAVPTDARDPRLGVSSYRIYLNPRVLRQEPGVLGRLVRHELTHATLQAHGRGAPLWITEGIAEYVSVRPMDPGRRRLPADALEVGSNATDLPRDADFAGSDAEAWYGVSWWVCEFIASTYGDATLFLLLDRLAGAADQSKVLPEVLGVTSGQLVQRGVALMAATYARTTTVPSQPATVPSQPATVPSESATPGQQPGQ